MPKTQAKAPNALTLLKEDHDKVKDAFDYAMKNGRKKVTIVRYKGQENTIIELDMDPLLEGGPVPPFYVKPRDVIYVPAKIQWF